nr:MAG TPA: hypothetical protein [Caudoviricetes sp.]
MQKSKLEVRRKRTFNYEDALAIVCLLCGILINTLLFTVGFWRCDNLVQIFIIYVMVGYSFAYAIFGLFRKVINFFERRQKW